MKNNKIKHAKRINEILAWLENMSESSLMTEKVIKYLYTLDKESLRWFKIKQINHNISGGPSYEHSLEITSSWEEAESLLNEGVRYVGNQDFWIPTFEPLSKEEVIKQNLKSLRENHFRMGVKCPHDGSKLWWDVDIKSNFDVTPYPFMKRKTRTNSRISSKMNKYILG